MKPVDARRKKSQWPSISATPSTQRVRVRTVKLDLASVEIVQVGNLVPVPVPERKLIEATAFAAYNDQKPIGQIISGAVEIARRRGFLFLTHREIGAALEGTALFAYSLALAIAVAAGPARAQSLCATVIQTTGALIILRQPTVHKPALVRDARAVLKTLLEL